MTPDDDVLAAFVKRSGTEQEFRKRDLSPYEAALEGYRAGHADCAAQGAKDREDALEQAARACEKRVEERFAEHGLTEPDTNASYYFDDGENQTRDEEDESCAQTIRSLKTARKAAK